LALWQTFKKGHQHGCPTLLANFPSLFSFTLHHCPCCSQYVFTIATTLLTQTRDNGAKFQEQQGQCC
jgi:hypothetical protein